MKLDYLLLDVFTKKPLSGNPLAVVPNAAGLGDNEMQAIAKEFNLSETIFIFPPEAEGNTASVRIFTPHQELPFAGHPTVGAAVVLGLAGGGSDVRIEEKVGLVSATVEMIDQRTGSARFTLPKLPEKIGELADPGLIAEALGISVDDIGCGGFEPAAYSAGNPFHLIPVKTEEVLRRIKPSAARWKAAFPYPRDAAYIFTLAPDEPDNDIAARMFSMFQVEDPGTGSAAAALIGMLAESASDGLFDYVIRQGHEMGRPCRITAHFSKANGALVHGAIGGEAVMIGNGVLEI